MMFPKPPNELVISLTVFFSGAKNCKQLEIALPKALNTSLVTLRIFMKLELQAEQKPATATPIAAIAAPIGLLTIKAPNLLNADPTPSNATVKPALNTLLSAFTSLKCPTISPAFEATDEPNCPNEEIGWRIALANLPRALDDSDILLSNCRNVSIGCEIAALRFPSLEPNSVALELVLVAPSAAFSAPCFNSSRFFPAFLDFVPASLMLFPAFFALFPASFTRSPVLCDF